MRKNCECPNCTTLRRWQATYYAKSEAPEKFKKDLFKSDKKILTCLVEITADSQYCDICRQYKNGEFATTSTKDETLRACEDCYPLLNDGMTLETAKMLAMDY
jgi:hypothetical protein